MRKLKRDYYVSFRILLVVAIAAAFIAGVVFNHLVTRMNVISDDKSGQPDMATRPRLYAFLPGTENIAVFDSWKKFAGYLNSKGHRISSVVFQGQTQHGGTVYYGCGEDETSCISTRTFAEFDVQNDQPEVIKVNFEQGAAGYPFLRSIWNEVNPAQLIKTLGTPLDVKAHVTSLDDGQALALIMFWDSAAMYYFIRHLDVSQDMSALNICITPNVSNMWAITVNNSPNLDQAVSKAINGTIGQYKSLRAGMFLGINDLQSFSEMMLRGRCIDTPFTFWYPDYEPSP
jgi:hypothetical protein